MKKDTTTIKRILRQTDNTNLHGYFQNEDNFIICNGYSIIKFDMNNIDFVADIDNLNNNTNRYYNYKSFNEHLTKNQDARKTYGSQTIEILVEDLKMWKKHGKKGKPFIIATKKGFMGLNPYYLLDLASLTRQDKNKLIKIKVLDKKAPLYIDGNGVKAILCPIVLNKTNFSKDDYLAFLDKLADCYDLEKNTQELKALEKANKPERNKKIKVSNMPIIIKNGVVCKDGYIYSDRNVDFFIYKNADNKTYTLYHLNSMLPCFTDCKSITAAIELIYDKLGEKSFIEKVIDIMQGNGAQERHATAGATLATCGCLEDVKHFIDKMVDFEPTPTPDTTETKEETTPDICADDMSATDTDTTETKTSDIVKADTVKDDTCTTTDTAATTDTNNRKKVLHGFYMTFKNRDIFVATSEDTKRRYIVQSFINEMINISNHLQNITEEKRSNILNDEDVLNETKKRIAPATIEEILTRQENHIRITTNNGNTIINQSLNGFKTIMLDCYSANEGITPAQEKSFKFFSGISRLNNQLTETITQDIKADLQADNRQTETTQDTTPKHTATKTKKAVSLFIVKDKPQLVKLPHLKPLNNIPTFQERFKTDFKQRNNARVYKHRVSNLKALKNDYMTFNNPVSCYSDKYAIGGKVAAGNTS